MSNSYLKKILFIIIGCLSSYNATAISGNEISNHLTKWLFDKGIEGRPIFSKTVQYKNCKNNLNIKKVFERYNTIRVHCPDLDGFNLVIRVDLEDKPKFTNNNTASIKKIIKPKKNNSKDKIKKTVQLIKLNKALEKNSTLELKDLKIVSSNNVIQSSFFNSKEELIGRKLKKNLKMDQLLHPRHLYEEFEVGNGDVLSIISNIGNASVIVSGEAQESGNLDDLIRVKNLRSGKIIKGYIKKNKIIKVFR